MQGTRNYILQGKGLRSIPGVTHKLILCTNPLSIIAIATKGLVSVFNNEGC